MRVHITGSVAAEATPSPGCGMACMVDPIATISQRNLSSASVEQLYSMLVVRPIVIGRSSMGWLIRRFNRRVIV
jgi:hypothetical protein